MASGAATIGAGGLRRLGEDLWVCEHSFRLLGITIASRMTVMRLSDGALFIHSPARLTPALAAALGALGRVCHVVCPNRFHHRFAGDYATAFRDVRLYAAPGLASKRRDLAFAGELGAVAGMPWENEIDQELMAGAPLLNEVVFRHRASRTLIVTDLVWNIGADSPLGLRLWARINRQYDKFGTVIEVRLAFRDRAAARASRARVLAWDFERVVMGHGRMVDRDARARLGEALRWLD